MYQSQAQPAQSLQPIAVFDSRCLGGTLSVDQYAVTVQGRTGIAWSVPLPAVVRVAWTPAFLSAEARVYLNIII